MVRVLNWDNSNLIEAFTEYEVALPDYGEVLAPTYIVPDPDGDSPLMLVQVISPDADLDVVAPLIAKSGTSWHASPQAKFERLFRETQIPIGLLCNGVALRLVYAPRGESSGHLTFPVQAMSEVSERLILGAMEMLLSGFRVFNAPTSHALKNLLEDSRKYQAEVSTTLANQVLDALWEVLRGFQMADVVVGGKLLGEIATTELQHIYLKLRELHAAMDKAVLNAYGWSDIPTDCTFLLDYDDEEDDEETSSGRQRKNLGATVGQNKCMMKF